MEFLDKAIELIVKFEGMRLEAYRCPAGVWTIGYGHTSGVEPGMKITEAEARSLLADDVAALNAQLENLIGRCGITLSDNQKAALLSFAFNVGFGALSRSGLWRKVAANPADEAIAAEFARWKYAGGKVMNGLVKRRAEEAAMYFSA